jgi:DNA-binding phage protein
MTSVLELQSEALSRVRESRMTAEAATADYVDAVQKAREALCSAQQIAMAAGVSRQAIHKTLRKGT